MRFPDPNARRSFENQLKNKLLLKTRQGVGEAGLLLRSFKFVDVGGRGTVPEKGFRQAMEKIGIVMEPEVRPPD